jgi:hypothetical protein
VACRRRAHSMAMVTDSRTSDVPRGWRVWRSDAGRYWATRMDAFSRAAERAGAARTVDGDTLPTLCRSIAEQESTAALAAAS